MSYYFTYGPYINSDLMKSEIGDFPAPYKGFLPDYKITFSLFRSEIRSGVVDISFSEGGKVYGMVYDLTVPQIDILTQREKGYHLTTRQTQIMNGMVVTAYLLVVQQRQGYIAPTREYLNVLKNAMVKQGFLAEIIQSQLFPG